MESRLSPALAKASLLALALAACAPAPSGGPLPKGPYVAVLGTAQDGGRPQIACRGGCCAPARVDPELVRYPSSLLLVDPEEGQRWLLDAGPGLPHQVELARSHGGSTPTDGSGRPALFDAILLTHAHIGHCLGLLHLGREVYGAQGQRVLCTPRMAAMLREEAPWSLLVEAGHLILDPVAPGTSIPLSPRVTATPLAVPHRDEFSDTVGWHLETPAGAFLYLPDIDKWSRWDRPLQEVVASVDLAFVDATFFDAEELPGRDMEQIPHPFVVETLALTEGWPVAERSKLQLLHLNHSNPLHDLTSPAAERVRRAGLGLPQQGEVLALGPGPH